jgi:hypothetical protein
MTVARTAPIRDPHREVLLSALSSIRERYEIAFNKTLTALAVLDAAMVPYPNSPLEPLDMYFGNLVKEFNETTKIYNAWSSVYYVVRFLES